MIYGYDSYGRPIGEDGYSRAIEGGMPCSDDGQGEGNHEKYLPKAKKGNTFFDGLIGKLIVFCLFVYGFPVAPVEIKWLMVVILCFYFRRGIFKLIKGFGKWLR